MYPLQFLLQSSMDVVGILNKKLEKYLEMKISSLMEVPLSLWSGIWIIKGKMIAIASWLPTKMKVEELLDSIMLDHTLVKSLKALLH